MKNNILIYSSNKNHCSAFKSILESLSSHYSFTLRGTGGDFTDFFMLQKWPTKKSFFCKSLLGAGSFDLFKFYLLKPLIQLFYFLELFIIRYKKKHSSIMLLNLNEKILISPIAKLLKIKTLWIESEDINYSSLRKSIIKKYIQLARENKIVCLNPIFKAKIENLGVSAKNISVISPAIECKFNKYQENIFSKIARNENNQVGKKFFTIGTITDLNDKAKIELLFSAFKNSMEIVPRTQLILVGQGEFSPDNNPWTKWLTKKMGIDTMVWFVTDTKNIKKWLDSFDIFVLSSRILNLDDFKTCLYAMEAGLAPLVPSEIGYDNLIVPGKNGYSYDINNSTSLSDLIIKLYKNNRLKIDLGNTAKENVNKSFQVPDMVESFKQIL